MKCLPKLPKGTAYPTQRAQNPSDKNGRFQSPSALPPVSESVSRLSVKLVQQSCSEFFGLVVFGLVFFRLCAYRKIYHFIPSSR